MGVEAIMNGEEHNHLNEKGSTNSLVSNSTPEGQKLKVVRHQSCIHQSHSHSGVSHLAASASSPSLLSGCGDSTTRTGACIEKHIHAHHVSVTQAASLCPQTDAVSASHELSAPVSPLPLPEDGDPPASLFLTPSSSSSPRHSQGRPVSAPPHHLERISGMLLRLVGDQYLCSTCGRQLRGIGDELTIETSLRHILSSDDIARLVNQ